MKIYEQAQEAAEDILKAFENPSTLPKPLAQVFIRRNDGSPCREWSWRNQLIVAIRGYADARGYRQWEKVGRKVKKGEKAFRIISPRVTKVTDKKTGEEKAAVFAFGGTPVFGIDQTEGDELPPSDESLNKWLTSLPLLDVARTWGLAVQSYNGQGAKYLGMFRRGQGIALGVENLATWAHELVHAADHRNGKLKELGQHWRSEIVAELGGAVLLQLLNYDHETDLGGCWDYVNQYAEKAGIDTLAACGKVLDRTCEAVDLILDTARKCHNARAIGLPEEWLFEDDSSLNHDENDVVVTT